MKTYTTPTVTSANVVSETKSTTQTRGEVFLQSTIASSNGFHL
jgi:hypothetical protein